MLFGATVPASPMSLPIPLLEVGLMSLVELRQNLKRIRKQKNQSHHRGAQHLGRGRHLPFLPRMGISQQIIMLLRGHIRFNSRRSKWIRLFKILLSHCFQIVVEIITIIMTIVIITNRNKEGLGQAEVGIETEGMLKFIYGWRHHLHHHHPKLHHH